MRLTDIAEQSFQHIVDTKRSMVVGDPEAMFKPVIDIWRSEQPLLSIFCFGVPYEHLDRALEAATALFRADAAALVHEAWGASSPINPHTGRLWGPGEMGDYIQRHGGTDAVVFEQLAASVCNSAGDIVSIVQPFTLERSSFGQLNMTLGERTVMSTLDDSVSLDGRFPDAMRAGMDAGPDVVGKVLATGREQGLDAFESGVMADAMAMRVLTEMGGVCWLRSDDARYAEAMERLTSLRMHRSLEEAMRAAGLDHE